MSEIFLIFISYLSILIKISKCLVLGIETLMIIQQMYHLFSIHSLRVFVSDTVQITEKYQYNALWLTKCLCIQR